MRAMCHNPKGFTSCTSHLFFVLLFLSLVSLLTWRSGVPLTLKRMMHACLRDLSAFSLIYLEQTPRPSWYSFISFALLLRSSHSQTVLAQSIDSAGQCSGKRCQILRRAELEMPPYFFALPRLVLLVYLWVCLLDTLDRSNMSWEATSQIVIKFRKGPLSEILNPLTFHPGSLLVLHLTQHLQQAIFFHLYRRIYHSLKCQPSWNIPSTFMPLKEWTPATLALSSSAVFEPKGQLRTKSKDWNKTWQIFYFYFSHTAVEGAICKNGLPVSLIPKTNRRQRITRVTLTAANCDHR